MMEVKTVPSLTNLACRHCGAKHVLLEPGSYDEGWILKCQLCSRITYLDKIKIKEGSNG